MSDKPTLEFWFEFASTYSYLAAMQIEDRAAEAGVEIAWRPFVLGPIFRAQGWPTSPFTLYPAKGAYMMRDMERLTEAAVLPWAPAGTTGFEPQNGMLAARVALAGEGEDWVPAFVRGVYVTEFGEGRDIADSATISRTAHDAGAPGDIVERAVAPDNKRALITRTDEAIRRGVFGAPSFFAGDELFWGQDRLGAALAWAERHNEGTSV